MDKKQVVKLWKPVNGELRLVDYGVASQAEMYARQGYIVEYTGQIKRSR